MDDKTMLEWAATREARRSNLVGSPVVFLFENGRQVGVWRCRGNAHQKRKEWRRVKRLWESAAEIGKAMGRG